MIFAALLPILGKIGNRVASSIFPDPADKLKAQALEQELEMAVLQSANDIEKAAAGIINTEAASKHWLAANWRPLTMLIFVGLVVARWMGYTAENMTTEEYLSIYDLIKIGLGGYVAGRTIEKITPTIANAIKNR